jgi:hypothetical protein
LIPVHSFVEKAKQLGPFTEFPAPGYEQCLAVRMFALDLRLESRQVKVGLIWDGPVGDEILRTAAPPNHY